MLVRDHNGLAVSRGLCLQCNSPEDLLDSTGKGLGWVARLSSSKTNKLSTGERKGSGNKDGTETTATVLKGARVVPELGTLVGAKVTTRGATTADEDDGDNHEDDDSGELEARTPKLLLGVTKCTKDVDEDDEQPEDGDPNAFIDVWIPVLHGEGGDG